MPRAIEQGERVAAEPEVAHAAHQQRRQHHDQRERHLVGTPRLLRDAELVGLRGRVQPRRPVVVEGRTRRARAQRGVRIRDGHAVEQHRTDPQALLGLPRRRPVERSAVQVHERYGAGRVDALTELELGHQLAATEEATLAPLVDRAGLEDDRRRHRLASQRHRTLQPHQGGVGGDRDVAVRRHVEDQRLLDVGQLRVVGQLGDADGAVPTVSQRRPADAEPVHVPGAGTRRDPDLDQASRLGTALGGRSAEAEEDTVADRARVDRLLRVEHLGAEVEVDRTGEGRHAPGPGQGDHVGRNLGAAAAQGCGEVADPRLGGVVEHDVVTRVVVLSPGRLDRDEQPHGTRLGRFA